MLLFKPAFGFSFWIFLKFCFKTTITYIACFHWISLDKPQLCTYLSYRHKKAAFSFNPHHKQNLTLQKTQISHIKDPDYFITSQSRKVLKRFYSSQEASHIKGPRWLLSCKNVLEQYKTSAGLESYSSIRSDQAGKYLLFVKKFLVDMKEKQLLG